MSNSIIPNFLPPPYDFTTEEDDTEEEEEEYNKGSFALSVLYGVVLARFGVLQTDGLRGKRGI